MKTRREVMRSIAISPALIHFPLEKHKKPQIERIRLDAGKLAELMQITCGGQWRVRVDKNLEFILVQKVLA